MNKDNIKDRKLHTCKVKEKNETKASQSLATKFASIHSQNHIFDTWAFLVKLPNSLLCSCWRFNKRNTYTELHVKVERSVCDFMIILWQWGRVIFLFLWGLFMHSQAPDSVIAPHNGGVSLTTQNIAIQLKTTPTSGRGFVLQPKMFNVNLDLIKNRNTTF